MLLEQKNQEITIARKTFPALRATAMKDFFNILRGFGMYREEWHDKSSHVYLYKPSMTRVDFVSVDQPIKVRSRRRDYLWMNEINEFTREDYRQLSMRTNKQIFGDYNPSHQYHWIYDDLQTREDCTTIISTYKDNPFLPEEIIQEIEAFKDKDENYWRVYGLGLVGMSEATVYNHWQLCDKMPEDGTLVYGLDFGFNNQTALIAIKIKDNDIYTDEIIYQSYLTNEALITLMGQLGVDKSAYIFADHDPGRINEINAAGYNIHPADKAGKNAEKNIGMGIDAIKSRKWYITKRSVNILKEVKGYCYGVDKNGNIKETPVALRDHAMDAIRYAVYSYQEMSKKFIGFI